MLASTQAVKTHTLAQPPANRHTCLGNEALACPVMHAHSSHRLTKPCLVYTQHTCAHAAALCQQCQCTQVQMACSWQRLVGGGLSWCLALGCGRCRRRRRCSYAGGPADSLKASRGMQVRTRQRGKMSAAGEGACSLRAVCGVQVSNEESPIRARIGERYNAEGMFSTGWEKRKLPCVACTLEGGAAVAGGKG